MGGVSLHGIGEDEEEWHRGGHPEIILDNLIAENKAVPMFWKQNWEG